MPRNVTLTFDDGSSHVYNNAPDTITPEEITQRASTEFPGKTIKNIDGGKSAAAPAPEKPLASSTRPRLETGVLEAAANMASGAIAKPASDVAGLGALALQMIHPSGIDPTAVKNRVQDAMTYEPRTDSGKAIAKYNPLALIGRAVDAVGHGAGDLIKGDAPADSARGMAGNALAEAVNQAPNFLGVKALENRGAIADAAKTAARRTGQAITPTIDAQTLSIAKKAEDIGIKVTPDMLVDNKFMRLIGQASRDVPLSGAVTHENRVAFNRAVIDSFGGDVEANKITPQVFSSAMSKHGKTIGDLSEKYPIDINQGLKGGLDQYAMDMRRETPDVRNIVDGYVFDIKDAAAKDGVIDGTAFRKIRSKVTGQMRRTNDGDLKYALSKLDDVMLDTIQSKLAADERPVFDQARAYYANGKTVEPLVAKAAAKGEGNMSPAALANRVTSTGAAKTNVAMGRGGDLADIAAAGSRFMTEPKSSMTTERGLTYGVLGGAGALHPLAAAALYGGANLYNRLGPQIARRIIKAQETAIEGRAGGGPINAGQPYVVGENGPEVVVPQQGGTVIPNQGTQSPGVMRRIADAMIPSANTPTTIPQGDGSALLQAAEQKYPFIKNHDVQVMTTPKDQKTWGYAETWTPGDMGWQGTKDQGYVKRPAEFAPNKVGIQIYQPGRFSVDDIAGEVLHADQNSNSTRDTLTKSLTPKQLELIRQTNDYKETADTETNKVRNGVDALMRAYLVNQWPADELAAFNLNSQQRQSLNKLKNYMHSGK